MLGRRRFLTSFQKCVIPNYTTEPWPYVNCLSPLFTLSLEQLCTTTAGLMLHPSTRFSWAFGEESELRLRTPGTLCFRNFATTCERKLPAKHVFIRILRGTRHLTGQTTVHWVTWLGSTFTIVTVAHIVASSIPVFSDLVSLVGALLATPLCFQPMGCMWLYDNWGPGRHRRSLIWSIKVAWCVFMIMAGFFLDNRWHLQLGCEYKCILQENRGLSRLVLCQQ
ncbi:amino acid transporter [Penicillium brevicompactum]|uniref:amino acid transporter n=1 Tax=Penicillium brevicompactum TaxID=5074 RepID=UPI00253FEF7D|nr:amino acid transporter [Penicillium brevicompactum]KAJ5327645.1 amino acid transporter [Penicillium brevicompactum]